MVSVELVGIILDISSSMDSEAFDGKSKFEAALEAASDVLERIKRSSVAQQFYFSLVGFSAGNEAAFLPPFSEDQKYMNALDIDLNLLSAFRQQFGSSSNIRSKYGRSGRTDYTTGLRKAIEATKVYIEDNESLYDDTIATRIMITDGCHNVNPRNNVYNAARELMSQGDKVFLGSILIGKDRCEREICGMCVDIHPDLKKRYENYISTQGLPSDFGLNRNCKDKFSFIFDNRDKTTLETVRTLLRLASTSYKKPE